MTLKRVQATKETCEVIEILKKEHGDLVFSQSGGCCDGTAPMCYATTDFYVPSRHIKLGEICGCEFYISPEKYEYFKHSLLTIEVKKENAAFGNSFSVEIDLGYQFVTKSRIMTDEEYLQFKEEDEKKN